MTKLFVNRYVGINCIVSSICRLTPPLSLNNEFTGKQIVDKILINSNQEIQ